MLEGNGIAKTILKDIVGEMAKRKGKKMLMIIGKGREEIPEAMPEDEADEGMEQTDDEETRIRALIEKILDERGE